jgi:hypothetical protein
MPRWNFRETVGAPGQIASRLAIRLDLILMFFGAAMLVQTANISGVPFTSLSGRLGSLSVSLWVCTN